MNYALNSDGILLPYFDANGAPLLEGNTQDSHYARIRLLHPPRGTGKYRQRQGTLPHVYLTPATVAPQSRPYDWNQVANDPTVPIIITEGELKAARCCMTAAFPLAIGLGGVDSFTGRRTGTPLLPELQGWEWKQRTVYIVFDADHGTQGYKPAVQQAIDRLAMTLLAYDARPCVVHLGKALVGSPLPQSPTEKVGLDDYINLGGDWPTLQLTQETAEVSDVIRFLLARYGIIRRNGEVLEFPTGLSWPVKTFQVSIAARHRVLNTKGAFVSAVPVFLASDRLTFVEQVGHWPAHPAGLTRIPKIEAQGGLPDVATADDTVLCFNQVEHPPGWYRMVLSQEEQAEQSAVVQSWCDFVQRFFISHPELALLFHDWVAWPLQHPGGRNYTSWILQSPETGIGKSLLAETPARMLASLGYVARMGVFDARFNYVLKDKLFVVFNEVGNEKDFYKDFRAYRTNDRQIYERKYHDAEEVRNFNNFLITTNEAIPYRIAAQERRDIAYSPPYKSHDAQWQSYLRTKVVPHLHGDTAKLPLLLQWYRFAYTITPGFDPTNAAPATASRQRMTEASYSPNEGVARSLFQALAGESMPIIEHRALRVGLKSTKYDYDKVLWHLKQLCGAEGWGTVVYWAADGSAQKVLVLRGSEQQFKALTRIDRERTLQASAQALMEWIQAEGL